MVDQTNKAEDLVFLQRRIADLDRQLKEVKKFVGFVDPPRDAKQVCDEREILGPGLLDRRLSTFISKWMGG